MSAENPANGVNEQLAERLAMGLYDRDFIQFGDFTLKSKLWSPVYVNLRGIGSFDYDSDLSLDTQLDIRDTVVDAYSELTEKLGDSDHILGIPEAAFTIAGMVGLSSDRSVLQMRVNAKEHGQPVGIEGNFKKGQTLVMLDDVVTTGGAKVEAAAKVRAQDLEPIGVVVLVDREQGGRQDVEAGGLKIESAIGMSTMIDILLANSRLTQDQHDLISAYMRGEITEKTA